MKTMTLGTFSFRDRSGNIYGPHPAFLLDGFAITRDAAEHEEDEEDAEEWRISEITSGFGYLLAHFIGLNLAYKFVVDLVDAGLVDAATIKANKDEYVKIRGMHGGWTLG